jgi:hypothetical protein
MKQDWKVVFPPAKYRTHRRRTFPPRGKSVENFWRPHFSRNRAPPHRRHRFAARKFAQAALPQRCRKTRQRELMFELGIFG